MSEYQEEVLTNILDLQAELRGDEPDPSAKPTKKQKAPTSSDEGSDPETLAVSEDGVTISLAARRSASLSVTDRIAAMNERLDRLEYDLSNVTKRIERIEPADETEAPRRPTPTWTPPALFPGPAEDRRDRLDQR